MPSLVPRAEVPEAGYMSFTPSTVHAVFKMCSVMATVKYNEVERNFSEDDLIFSGSSAQR